MRLDKATELNTETAALMAYSDLADKRDAILLGIEALEAIIEWRSSRDDDLLLILPGETEE